jgi:recombination protein RecA
MSGDGLSIHLPGVISTGSEWLDWSIGRGGLPRGRIVLVSADEGAGKTTLALHMCANAQRAGGFAFYFDAEYKLDLSYAEALGVDSRSLILSQPEHADMMFNIIDDVIKIQAKSEDDRPVLIVVDSISSLPTQSELEGNAGVGATARCWSTRLKMVNRSISKGGVCLLLISQHREKIGVMFGNSKTTSGGNAPRFYCTVGIRMDPSKALKEDGQVVGRYVKAEVWKNQVAPPFRRSELLIRFGKGIDYVHSLHHALIACGAVEEGKSGWTTFAPGTEREFKWQGASGLRTHLMKPERRTAMMEALRGPYGWPT